jgi:chemotaxis protein CheX
VQLGNEVRALVESIWATVLGWEAEPAEAPETEGELLIGSVRISGAWEGEVRLGCPAELARQASGAMLGLPPEVVAAADVADALGELTNILGGNLKALLPGANALGLPSVVEGPGPAGGEALVQAAFRCRQGPFWVSVEARPGPREAAGGLAGL